MIIKGLNRGMKMLILFIGISTLSFQSYAQLSGGPRLAFDLYLFSGRKAPSVGGFMEWSSSDMGSMRIGGSFAPPIKETVNLDASANYGYTHPQHIEVELNYKYSFYHLYYDYKRYYGAGGYTYGGFYTATGVGYNLAIGRGDIDFGSYSQNLYSLDSPVQVSELEVLGQFMLRGYVGYELNVDFGMIAPELGVSVPANQINGAYVPISLPPFIEAAIAIRF